jgi:hypothetical protein
VLAVMAVVVVVWCAIGTGIDSLHHLTPNLAAKGGGGGEFVNGWKGGRERVR